MKVASCLIQTNEMNIITHCFFLQLALKLITGSALPSVEIEDEEAKIVGGSEGNKDDYPYVVSLRTDKNQHFCGGTLVDHEHVITAAHCVIGGHAKYVVVGCDLLDRGGIKYSVVSNHTHPRYNEKQLKNDIAILKLSKKATYKFSFPERMQTDLSNYEDFCYVMGWGLTEAGGKLSNKFKVASVKLVSPTDCEKEWKEFYNRYLICTRSEGNGTCQGDSGGPLVCENHFAGIVSFGKPCARGKPDVFTAVNSYKDWIDSVISQD